ncbi:hypothetical protein MHH70_17215 [Metasolibacillus sp. FSL H7-0170]|uniref:hypothetical protein n=1 Tax=Metasolibacillus sp. FSL H7-0170 TaxID=2921431 RepID=UPI0031594011
MNNAVVLTAREKSAMKLLDVVHGDNKLFAQLFQLKGKEKPICKSYNGKNLSKNIPNSQWIGEDVYFSLNTFKDMKRRSEGCVRLNALYTDLDCYKVGIEAFEAREMIDKMIADEKILTPNIIIYSGRGLQLIWLMEFMSYKNYLKLWERMQEEIYKRFHHLNADRQAKSVTQLFRLAGSISSRTQYIVLVEYLKHNRYSIEEMKGFLLPEIPPKEKCTEVTPTPKRQKKKQSQNQPILTRYSLNEARLKDFEQLLEIQPVVNRKSFLFNYAICAKALGRGDNLIEQQLQHINSRFSQPLPKSRIQGAIRSANLYKEGYKKRNDTLIDELNITLEEQRQLTTIISKQVKKEREQKQKEAKRRANGVRPTVEYQADRRKLHDERVLILAGLLENKPKLKNKELAALLNVSESTIKRMKAEIKSSS